MRLILAALAVMCGIVLIFGLDTGELSQMDVAGVGIVFAALATVAP